MCSPLGLVQQQQEVDLCWWGGDNTGEICVANLLLNSSPGSRQCQRLLLVPPFQMTGQVLCSFLPPIFTLWPREPDHTQKISLLGGDWSRNYLPIFKKKTNVMQKLIIFICQGWMLSVWSLSFNLHICGIYFNWRMGGISMTSTWRQIFSCWQISLKLSEIGP